ncbi:hypothetical protein V8F33_009102 [Rhypophila sp. PSN 637]
MQVGTVMLRALALSAAMATAFVTVNESSMNPIFRGPDTPYAGVLPPLLNETHDSSAVNMTTIAPEAPLRPTESVMTTTPSRTTSPNPFVRPTDITLSPTATSSNTASMTPTNTPPNTHNHTETISFFNNPLTVALVALAIILPFLVLALIVWAIRRHRKRCESHSWRCFVTCLIPKKRTKPTQNIPLRRLTPVQSNPYYIDLELGSGFGWGKLSGLSVFMTEEAAYRRGGRGGGADDESHGVARPQPAAKVVGRVSRFLEMF